jgi:hypothetical protein
LFLDYLDLGGRFKETSFRKAVKKYFPYFKKASKETDLCHYCEYKKKLQEKLQGLIDTNCLHSYTPAECFCEFEDPAFNKKKVAIKAALQLITKHKKNKVAQRKAFLQQQENLKAGEFLLVMGF